MHPRRILVALLVLSVAARWILCGLGGQYFFNDEGRFDRGQALYRALVQGDGPGIRRIASLPDHVAFSWLGAGVTAVQRACALATPFSDWAHHPEFAGFTIRIAAAILSLFSVLNVYLVWRIAVAAGADEGEALWCAGILAASNTGLYFARHLLPYDAALSAFLTGLLLGLRARSWGAFLMAGLAGAAAYGLYNGYWFLPIVLVASIAVWVPGSLRWTAIAGCLVGGAIGGAILLGAGIAAGGATYLHDVRAFSGTVTQGLFSEGWSLPWAYLYHSECAAGLVVALGVALALLLASRSPDPLPARARLWLVAAGLAYALMVLASVAGHWLVVYARTAKALVPLLALSGGWSLASLLRGRRALAAVVGLAFVFSFGSAFAVHANFTFPRDVELQVLRTFGNTKHSLSVSGSIYQVLGQEVRRPDLDLVNAQFLYPVRGPVGFPEGKVILRFENPLSYLPFQYDGHTPREREVLRSADISIQLIRLRDPHAVPDDLPWALRFQPADRATGR